MIQGIGNARGVLMHLPAELSRRDRDLHLNPRLLTTHDITIANLIWSQTLQNSMTIFVAASTVCDGCHSDTEAEAFGSKMISWQAAYVEHHRS